MDVDAQLPGDPDELRYEVTIEPLKRAIATVDDRHRRPGPGRDMRELEGDVAAADEDHTARQLIEIEEAGAGREVLLAWEPERGVPRSGRNRHVLGGIDIVPDVH